MDKTSGQMDDFPFKWFHGSLLNYAENLLKYNDSSNIAIYSYGEAFNQNIETITFKKLRDRVRIYQIALRNAGIKKGDRVVGKYI